MQDSKRVRCAVLNYPMATERLRLVSLERLKLRKALGRREPRGSREIRLDRPLDDRAVFCDFF